MGLNERSYWWVSCDAPGCNGGDELNDQDSAYLADAAARDAGYVKRDGVYYCTAHRGFPASPLATEGVQPGKGGA